MQLLHLKRLVFKVNLKILKVTLFEGKSLFFDSFYSNNNTCFIDSGFPHKETCQNLL